MKQPFRIALFFATLALPLAAASTAHAAQSAIVGKLKQDGTIQLYANRFQDHFADGTPVAKVEAKKTDGIVRIERRSADGCLVESTQLDVLATTPDGWHPLSATTAHPLSLFRCMDNGCAAEFTEGVWTAACGDFGSVEPYVIHCICIRNNGTDQIIGESGDYCRRFVKIVLIWDLLDWIHPPFVQ